MIRAILFLMIASSAGCADVPSYPARSHVLDPMTAAELPGGEEMPADASVAAWKASGARLEEDVLRAIRRSDWGLIESFPAVPAKLGSKSGPSRAQALLPDNRIAQIHAWVISNDRVAVSVKIGRFGDAQAQQLFLQVVADTLADKPKPKRGGLFFLPDP